MWWCRSWTDSAATPFCSTSLAHAQILASATNLACRHLIERQPELVSVYETSNTRFITDLDTLEDMQTLARRTGWQLELPPVQETVERCRSRRIEVSADIGRLRRA